MEICHLLPTKFARDESRSLPRPLLAAEGATVAVAEGAIDWPEGTIVGIRRSPRPSNTGSEGKAG